jgi:enoyl-[acyl-carrier protein] reductase/trans-2-enoyl-CoA reductase (NAD+)
MTARVISPVERGLISIDAHPEGCQTIVRQMQSHAQSVAPRKQTPACALILGSSAGYGLGMTVAAIARYGISGIGVSLEKGATPGRTATAGWYRTNETAEIAAELDIPFSFVNGDCFKQETKEEVLQLIEEKFGGVDYLIYSVAAPRRVDPQTGVLHKSVIKPIGHSHTTKAVKFEPNDDASLTQDHIDPATEDDILDTVAVMGGADWRLWIDALTSRNLIRPQFRTVALSYIGSDLTSAIYRDGTIGMAKADLEQTARDLNSLLHDNHAGEAFTSVHGAVVTQASTAIPSIGLYISLLRGAIGQDMEDPIDQAIDLWDALISKTPVRTDKFGRIRLDSWELDEKVQQEVKSRWAALESGNLKQLADVQWFRNEVRRLYGFGVSGVDYALPSEPDTTWGLIQ